MQAADVIQAWRRDPTILSADWEAASRKLSRVREAAARGTLACVADFDRTLSVARMPGGSGKAESSHGVIENCGFLPDQYHEETKRLFETYYPVEMSATATEQERLDACVSWWNQAHELLVQHGLTRDTVRDAVAACERVALREKFDEFLSLLQKCGAPLLADVWSQVRVLRPCKSAFGLASMSRGHTGI